MATSGKRLGLGLDWLTSIWDHLVGGAICITKTAPSAVSEEDGERPIMPTSGKLLLRLDVTHVNILLSGNVDFFFKLAFKFFLLFYFYYTINFYIIALNAIHG